MAAIDSPWLLYGANGFTGRLIAREAVRRGMRPVLAGRNGPPVRELAAELGCRSRCFDLRDPARVAAHLHGHRLVLNCAGPFSVTAGRMMEACLAAGAHYLDITGEIDCIEAAAALHARAGATGVLLLPAVGFDVVPTDYLAARLAAAMPHATRLELAFRSPGHYSPGTLKTILENLPRGGRSRIDGRLRRVPPAWKVKEIPLADGPGLGMTIPWGDLATAYHSTGIANIDTYIVLPQQTVEWMRRLRGLAPLAGLPTIQRLLGRLVDWRVRGPTPDQMENGVVSIWGRASDEGGRWVEGTLRTPDPYPVTVACSLTAVERVLVHPPPPGFATPSRALGMDFLGALLDVKLSFGST
jgi:short subunit dehydrogenase-like uncharacterized protein